MLYGKKIAVCSEIHTEGKNALYGQNVEFSNAKPGGTFIIHRALRTYWRRKEWKIMIGTYVAQSDSTGHGNEWEGHFLYSNRPL